MKVVVCEQFYGVQTDVVVSEYSSQLRETQACQEAADRFIFRGQPPEGQVQTAG